MKDLFKVRKSREKEPLRDDTAKKVERVREIKRKLEAAKALYQEMDELVVILRRVKNLEQYGMRVVDNFIDKKTGEEKNTSFRACGVKRFELAEVDDE